MKGFVISWFFPPMNSSERLVTFKLLKASNFEYDVFTQNTCQNWSYGNTEKRLQSKNIHPIFSKKETYEEWIEDGLNYFSKNKDKYDFIMSRATPKESHLLALKIKEKYPDVKWIASFGDPLANSPYEQVIEKKSPFSLKGRTWNNTSKKYIFSPKRIIRDIRWNYKNKEDKLVKKEKKKAVIIEQKTLEIANIIILNNDYQKKYMMNNYDEHIQSKVLILNHTYDENFYPKEVKKVTNKKKIVYLGHLDMIRNAQVFLEAIHILKEKYPDLSQNLEVEFYGNMSDKDKLYIINNELYDIVKIKKSVDYFTSLKIMKENEWLLLIDANLEKVLSFNPYFAAKLADYIGTHNKILAITMNYGASADIVKRVGGIVKPYNAKIISNTIEEIIKNNLKYQENIKESNKFSNLKVAKIYDNYIIRKLGEQND